MAYRPPISNVPALRGVTIPPNPDPGFVLRIASELNAVVSRLNALSQDNRDQVGAPSQGRPDTPTTVDGDVEADVGTGPAPAYDDHQHPLDTDGSPGVVGGSAAQGAGPGVSLNGHTHDLTNLRLVEGSQATLSVSFKDGAFGVGSRLGCYRKAEEEIHFPSTTTGDGGVHLSLVSSGAGNPRGALLDTVAEDDEGIASLGAYSEGYAAGIFAETFGSATAGNSLGRPKATSSYYGCFGRDLVVGLSDEFDLYLVTNSVARFYVDATDGHLIPGAADTYNLGAAATRLANVYLGQVIFKPVSPAQITSDQNNYSPGAQGFVRLSTDAARSLTGMVAQPDGTQRVVVNVGSNSLILEHEHASSTDVNRFLCASGADITLAANEMAVLVYDATTQRWRAGKLA
jgi:hypothetical protein